MESILERREKIKSSQTDLPAAAEWRWVKVGELSAPFSMLLQQLGNLQSKTGSLNFN
jgi:hypothetical protein